MPGETYRKINGKWQWVKMDEPITPPPASSPAIHQDTLDRPIRNMATGEVYDSKSAYLKNLPKGCEVVGNDLLSGKKSNPPEKITEARILDAMQKAEAICSDPVKYRARQNENFERLERANRLLNGNRR